ncbi:hypothetical protein B0T16DRAFT_455730 [Cercophora newfieldiana]|uniref:Uncharacterized protein n=1 Tax=Cercophora newfieldiana TaxID=92897 RepID=A0AA40CR82_9PEZI|nr:hypothetical protein B0T16DRAFT_455730 [Cercophora newfieldiana]
MADQLASSSTPSEPPLAKSPLSSQMQHHRNQVLEWLMKKRHESGLSSPDLRLDAERDLEEFTKSACARYYGNDGTGHRHLGVSMELFHFMVWRHIFAVTHPGQPFPWEDELKAWKDRNFTQPALEYHDYRERQQRAAGARVTRLVEVMEAVKKAELCKTYRPPATFTSGDQLAILWKDVVDWEGIRPFSIPVDGRNWFARICGEKGIHLTTLLAYLRDGRSGATISFGASPRGPFTVMTVGFDESISDGNRTPITLFLVWVYLATWRFGLDGINPKTDIYTGYMAVKAWFKEASKAPVIQRAEFLIQRVRLIRDAVLARNPASGNAMN